MSFILLNDSDLKYFLYILIFYIPVLTKLSGNLKIIKLYGQKIGQFLKKEMLTGFTRQRK